MNKKNGMDECVSVCVSTDADAYLLWCLSTFQINPESGYIYDQTDDSNDKEFNLQMCGDDFQQQFNFCFKHSTNQQQFHECAALLLFTFAPFAYTICGTKMEVTQNNGFYVWRLAKCFKVFTQITTSPIYCCCCFYFV